MNVRRGTHTNTQRTPGQATRRHDRSTHSRLTHQDTIRTLTPDTTNTATRLVNTLKRVGIQCVNRQRQDPYTFSLLSALFTRSVPSGRPKGGSTCLAATGTPTRNLSTCQ